MVTFKSANSNSGKVDVILAVLMVPGTALFLAIQIATFVDVNRPLCCAEIKILGISELSVTHIKVLGVLSDSHESKSLSVTSHKDQFFPCDSVLYKLEEPLRPTR